MSSESSLPPSPPQPDPLEQCPPNCRSELVCNTSCFVPIPVGPNPIEVECPFCIRSVVTTVKNKPTFKTHTLAGFLCIFGCWPCAVCPYCIDDFQRAVHYCPACNRRLGAYNR